MQKISSDKKKYIYIQEFDQIWFQKLNKQKEKKNNTWKLKTLGYPDDDTC